MPKRLDAVIVVDVEATCWEGNPPPGQINEIIEIGVCLLDIATGERWERRSLLVRPEYSSVSPFCTALTTLTPAQVETGLSFQEACRILQQKYQTMDRPWASFGDYDRIQFERDCERKQVRYPFGRRHINIKTLAGLKFKRDQEPGMPEALSLLKLPLEGTHHRGGDDAWNIAAILAALL